MKWDLDSIMGFAGGAMKMMTAKIGVQRETISFRRLFNASRAIEMEPRTQPRDPAERKGSGKGRTNPARIPPHARRGR
jgi:hypothetical protein